jgi:hypothetical protein
MKIRSVKINNKRKMFEVNTSSRKYLFPFSKSVDQLVSLLQILDCEVDLLVRAKSG